MRRQSRGGSSEPAKHNSDKAKKEFTIQNSKELARLREKYAHSESGRAVKPNFFAAKDRGKGYYDSKKKYYKKHLTTMDFLQECVNSYNISRTGCNGNGEFLPFSAIVDFDGYCPKNTTRTQVARIISIVRSYAASLSSLGTDETLTEEELRELARATRQETIEYIGNIKLTRHTMVALLLAIEADKNSDIRRHLFNTLFGYPNTTFYECLAQSREPVGELHEAQEGTIVMYGKTFQKWVKMGQF